MKSTNCRVVAAYSFSLLASVKPTFISMTFSMQLHILRWYVTAVSTSTFMGTAYTDCMCYNHIVYTFAGHTTICLSKLCQSSWLHN